MYRKINIFTDVIFVQCLFSLSARTQFVGSCVFIIALTTITIIVMVAALATPPLEDGGSCEDNPNGPEVTSSAFAAKSMYDATKQLVMSQLGAGH